ncbi:hypothetical protein JR316_0004779 [Psilocybe cubensis]|uniref:Uncharacterized protein n=2 Tax=Psilocybe cubensis TaxID=181762 RepID=A0A8H7XX05_PSICU|nr:hypothetical protein JR316_0004779 [Psilocybe cubensis]KAH9482679.1 hypothetical protein JR316_0004779 [Psilocybe cubensis]
MATTAAVAPDPEPPTFPIDISPITPTDYGTFVTRSLARGKRDNDSNSIDQRTLRNCLSLASSFLMTDTAIDPRCGAGTWSTGLLRLVDLVIVLHRRNELELETLNSASRACSECWTATGNWRGLAECRQCVREAAEKLKKILDPDKTYKGERIYAP